MYLWPFTNLIFTDDTASTATSRYLPTDTEKVGGVTPHPL